MGEGLSHHLWGQLRGWFQPGNSERAPKKARWAGMIWGGRAEEA